MITIKELTTADQLEAFVKFPFLIFEDNPYWVPPIISEEIEIFDREVNPIFNNAEAHLFMAYKNGRPVGRIAAIINWLEVKEQEKQKMRFGWFDTVDDVEVSNALLGEVEKIGREQGLSYMEGPVGFSNMDKAGLLVEGFQEMNTMITWYSHPYYRAHLEELGFEKANEWVEFEIKIPEEGSPEKVRRFAKLIMERYDLNVVKFTSVDEILDNADEMFNLVNQTYNHLNTFTPIRPEQVGYYKEKYFRYLHPDFINCLADKDGNLVAFAITMPSFAKALKRAYGTLLPLGWFHLLKARYFPKRADFYLIGIKPDYQNKGLTSIIFNEMNVMFNRRGITEVETNPELVENKAIQALWTNYDSRLHKRRRSYRKAFNE